MPCALPWSPTQARWATAALLCAPGLNARTGLGPERCQRVPWQGASAILVLLQANSVNLDIKRVVGYRHWCNKLWNAVRFAAGHLPPGYQPPAAALEVSTLPWACRWVLSRLDRAIAQTNTALQEYAFSDATTVRPCLWLCHADERRSGSCLALLRERLLHLPPDYS